MTRKEALQELLVKVRAGEWYPGLAQLSFGGVQNYYDALNAYDGSMDAALSLFEAVLPGWEWWLESSLGASIKLRGARYWSNHIPFTDTTPSRALLIAILEELVAMEDDE